MEAHYRAFTIDELTHDDRFRQWVIERDPVAERFWLEWLTQNPDKADTIQMARAFLLALEEENTSLPAAGLADITDEIVQTQPDRRTAVRTLPFWRNTAFRVAASVLLVLGLGYAALRFTGQPERQMQARLRRISPALADGAITRTNTTQQVQDIRLDDGSIVQLYPNSSLNYPAHFAANSREVFLRGRAFFRIARNPKKPFWVYTGTLSTQVLGTRFMVDADAGQANVQVTSGRVSVYRSGDVERARRDRLTEQIGVILTANQQVVYTQTDEQLVKTVVARPTMLQPGRADAFVFEETPIAEVFARLETIYGLPVLYDASTMSRCYLTANLTDESLFDKLALICKITRSSYELVDGQIVIHSNGCDNN
ncbi:FecR family protein [Larkinella soli]|uniref:FecR family protein n=1 Tax=Larkinella soli TaxID=1770527 RepID=UPI000FFBCDB8|nr:FecR family protein [Larkinella soli]